MKRNCKRCLKLKLLTEFSRAPSNKDGHSLVCKSCVAEHVKKYYKTVPGIISNIYNGEITASVQRGHKPPTYTKQELSDWLHANGLIRLFNNWELSGYVKNLRPSVDRINSTEGYSFTNIRLVTWKENNDAAYEERKSCKRVTRQCQKIVQLTLSGEYMKTHLSISKAARDTGFCRTNINYACKGGRPEAHGFVWQYA
jgi:hypothetical protein